MSEWSKQAAETLRHRVERKSKQDAGEIEKRTALEQQGTKLWHEVRDLVKTKCEELNKDYGEAVATFLVTQNSELHVQLWIAGAMGELEARFTPVNSPEALKWSYLGATANSGRGGGYGLHVDKGVVSLHSGGQAVSTETVAATMLDGLLAG
jgi:hypothetical protein